MTSPSIGLCARCGAVLRDGNCAACLLQCALNPDFDADAPELRDAWRFGDYQIEEKIARGGMGVVYRARQLSLNRPVALKMILGGELAPLEAVRRFRIEAEAAAKLRHPNIVSIYEVGEWDHEHYLSMELMEGGSLADHHPWEPKEAAALTAKLAHALAYAHEHGVLHRDLKPSNILLDSAGEPRLADFGLAKLASQDLALTLSHVTLGSPGYVAPEQASHGDVTTAADVYGLGAVLYEMLSGRPPFSARTAVETLRRVMEDPPAPLPKSVPQDLRTICLKCLEKTPAARYASARELAEDCERFLKGEIIRARRITPPTMVWRWMKRRPLLAALAGTTLLAMLGGVTGIFWQWQRAETANAGLQKSITQLEWRRTVQLLSESDRSPGLAHLARMLRRDPANPMLASMAISALEQSRLATPVARSIIHGKNIIILQARLSPDAQRIVTAGADGTARLWDAETSSPVGSIMQHGGVVRWVAFSADGRRIATASDDGTARIWDGASGEPISPPFPHEGAVSMVAFAGEALASISADGTARLWPSGKKLLLMGAGRWLVASPDHSRIYTCAANGIQGWSTNGEELFRIPVVNMRGITLSPDGTRLAGWAAREMQVWSAADGSPLTPAFEGATSLLHAAWSPDGTRLAGAAESSWARIWNANTGAPVTNRLMHTYGCEVVAFSPDGHTLMSGGDDGKVRLWNVTSGAPESIPLPHNDGVLWAEYSKDGTHLLATSRPWASSLTHGMGEVQYWDLRPRGRQPWRFKAAASTGGMAWSHDGRLCATSATNGDVYVHDPFSGRMLHGPWKCDFWCRAIAFLPGDRHVALVTGKGELSVWSLDTNERVVGPVQNGSTETGRFSRDGMKLLVGGTNGNVRLYDLRTGKVICEVSGHIAPINGLAFSPDDKLIATGGEEGLCFISDAATGKPHFPGGIRHDNQIVSVQFSPDGKWFVTSSHDRTARIWSTQTGAPHGTPMLHRGEVAYAEFSPDGARVLTACRDGTTRLWDAATGAAIIEPMQHTSAVRGATFSRDGKRIATEDHDGLRLWDAATGEPLSVLQPHTTGRGIGYNGQGMHVTFSPDGQSITQGTASPVAIMWHFPQPPVPAPSWLPEALETLAGVRVGQENVLETVPTAQWIELREKMQSLQGDDFYSRWAREFRPVER